MEKALAFLKESPMVRTISICEKDIMVGFIGDERRESELLKQISRQAFRYAVSCGSRAAWSLSSCRSQIIIRKRWCCPMKTNPVYKRECMVSARSFRLALVLLVFNGSWRWWHC